VAARKKKNPSVLFDRRSLPSVPAIAPGWDAFYLATFFRILSDAWRRIAHLSVLALVKWTSRQSTLWALLSRPAPLCKDQSPRVGSAAK
jgi:hypothetical protein